MHEYESAPATVADIAQMLLDKASVRETLRNSLRRAGKLLADCLMYAAPASPGYIGLGLATPGSQYENNNLS